MISPDAREVVFAGAGILWGATTFFQGLNIWRADRPSKAATSKTPLPSSLIAGFVLVIACTAYLAWRVHDSLQ